MVWKASSKQSKSEVPTRGPFLNFVAVPASFEVWIVVSSRGRWIQFLYFSLSLILGINMLNSQIASTHMDNGLGLHGENENVAAPGNGVPPVNPDGPPALDPVDVNSCIAINGNLGVVPENSICRDARAADQNAQSGEEGGISLQIIFEMLQTQQAAIAQL
uniref:Uncharacterized protein LOC104224871 n=1 Tax=Nicotiana sylvestris TaxID=4096 RepID=A0A1U7W8D4_NICSY|nr:PREDICTED: uncharacterized protein LOC104224871 [Nicotiana sylvestris]